jgi:hypothetical protein
MLKILQVFSWPVLAALLVQCIGTDVVDDANDLFTVTIQAPSQNSLLVGETLSLTAERQTMSGDVVPTEMFTWISSSPEVAEVSPQGVVQAIAAGQTRITAAANGSTSDPVLLTVVASEDQVAEIVLSAESMSLSVGDMLSIMAMAKNILGDNVPDQMYTWASSDESVATVDASGLVTAVGNGSSQIKAQIGEIESEPFDIIVGATARSGTFEGSGSYNAKGTATLSLDDAGDVILTTSEDFEADLALGTFLYLSNSTSGTVTSSEGIEISDISDNPRGSKTFNVSEINDNVDLNTYRYVVILCKPARITFGFADLNE